MNDCHLPLRTTLRIVPIYGGQSILEVFWKSQGQVPSHQMIQWINKPQGLGHPYWSLQARSWVMKVLLPDVSSSPGRWMKLELRCHRNWLYSKIWKQMQAPEWQGDIIVIITRSSLFADNVFLGCSNARCLDLMCGASSQLRSRNSNTSLDKEGNAIRAVVLSR
jgi:hypothetical protein